MMANTVDDPITLTAAEFERMQRQVDEGTEPTPALLALFSDDPTPEERRVQAHVRQQSTWKLR